MTLAFTERPAWEHQLMVWTFSGCSACWGSAPGSRMACRATLLPERMNSYLSDCHLHRGFASWQTMLNASHSLSCREATVYNNVCAFARLNVISVLSRHIVFFYCLAGISKISTGSAPACLGAMCYYLLCGRLWFCCLVGCCIILHWGHCQVFLKKLHKSWRMLFLLMSVW